ncbi:threonine synthase [Nitritalea halalkaliphila LW7]|uniref:Threonine synthase n=1 Tax=Nitritalea halalkaliphila LW7 TaxID=1189621 RepID=I5C5N5_9BACT|nr:threonine synthase [Nitritalea halalkaliphila]EIM77137.1 threonine synthase [Nitritalea halalkaliphila LW7]
MQFYSTQNPAHRVGLKEAVIQGLAPDQGLYMPVEIPTLPADFFQRLPSLSFAEIGQEVIGALFGDSLSEAEIRELVEHTLQFDAPLVEVEPGIYSLELFHGPTLAFKDFGARFCSKLMALLLAGESRKVRVLVATSGDTGSAVANGFYRTPGVEVVVLYPRGKVSVLQEKQFTTLGENIVALEVDGVFDDCQRLVKEAFLDAELREQMLLTSANSINVARWIPQALYYFRAFAQLPQPVGDVAFSVPSGNFGNLAAGILAARMGLPIRYFVAATNVNKVVPDFLNGADFQQVPSVQTISNSMDVGNPSNFSRLLALYGGDEKALRAQVKGFYFDDPETAPFHAAGASGAGLYAGSTWCSRLYGGEKLHQNPIGSLPRCLFRDGPSGEISGCGGRNLRLGAGAAGALGSISFRGEKGGPSWQRFCGF